MSSTSQESSGQAVPRPQARTLLTTFTTFLTLAIHTLLYHRHLYPQETFLLAKHHNLPIPQSRHPGLCAWINDSVAQIQPLLAQGRLARVCINLHLPESLRVIERWLFDLSRFPTWIDGSESANGLAKGKGKALTWEERERRERRMLRGNADEVSRDEAERESSINWLDVDEAIRGALRRIAYTAETKGALPEGSTFTLAVELKDDAPAPVGHPQPWIPSEPDLQPPTPDNPTMGAALGGSATTPLRNVQAGPLFFECWVEEGRSRAETAPIDVRSQGS